MNNEPALKGEPSRKAEPVAYIPFAWYCAWLGDSVEPVWEQYEECHPATKQWDNFPDKIIPLYTHPAKTLTEPSVKEITDLWLDVVNNIPANDKRPREWHFANAILRKAQEK